MEAETVASDLIAQSIAALGVKVVFGIVGVPVTRIAYSIRELGLRFISCRTETSAGYAATGYAYLNFDPEAPLPGIVLSTGGPGFMNALSCMSHATSNRVPMVLIAGSCSTEHKGKGAFQELDQYALVAGQTSLVREAFKISAAVEIPSVLLEGCRSAIANMGAVYIDVSADLLASCVSTPPQLKRVSLQMERLTRERPIYNFEDVTAEDLNEALELLKGASRPLFIFGKGAASVTAQALQNISTFVDNLKVPFIFSPMGRGILPDEHRYCVAASRSRVLAEADVVFMFGCRLNWLFQFGEPPKWKSSPKFVLFDLHPFIPGGHSKAIIAHTVTKELSHVFNKLAVLSSGITLLPSALEWSKEICEAAVRRRNIRDEQATIANASNDPRGMTYYEAYAVISQQLKKEATNDVDITIVAEGFKVMDVSRVALPVFHPRGRLDAGTWGTMGVGIPYAAAAALSCPSHFGPKRNSHKKLVVAFEGDSAIGFSLPEIDTLVRYNLSAIFLVFNNGGIYTGAGDDREGAGVSTDPVPTQLSQDTRYDICAEGFGGRGFSVTTVAELAVAFKEAISHSLENGGVSLINIRILPEDLDSEKTSFLSEQGIARRAEMMVHLEDDT